MILDNNDVPLKRAHLERAQPVYLLSPVGLELGQPSIHMDGMLISTAPLELYDDNTCHVCFEWAVNVGNSDDRYLNCVRCVPDALCNKCRVTLAGQSVCLQCLESSELELIGEKHCRRRMFVM